MPSLPMISLSHNYSSPNTHARDCSRPGFAEFLARSSRLLGRYSANSLLLHPIWHSGCNTESTASKPPHFLRTEYVAEFPPSAILRANSSIWPASPLLDLSQRTLGRKVVPNAV